VKYLRQRKCKQRCIKVSYPSIYCISLHVNDAPQTHGVYLALSADDTFLYATDHKEGFVLRKCSGVSAQWSCGVSTGT
jgi:hypothetical protein